MDDVNESFIVLPGWIWQIPIIVESSADIGAAHVAAHGDRGVRFWDIRNQLGILRFLHVDAVKLFHESYGILIDLRLGFHTCGIKIKNRFRVNAFPTLRQSGCGMNYARK